MKTQKSRPAKKHNTLRHVIQVTDGLLVTIDGKQRTEVNKPIRHGANPVTKPCVVAGCDKPRMTNLNGKTLTMCEEHQREYWRSRYTPTGGKPERPLKSAAAQLLPAPEPPMVAPLRIIALRCATCGVKYPYTDEHFDISAQAQTCRHCATAPIVIIVDPITSTARRARLLVSDEPVSCGEGAEAYAAFARAEKAAGHHVVIEW